MRGRNVVKFHKTIQSEWKYTHFNMDEVIKELTETTHNVDETWTKLRDTVYQGAFDMY